MTTFRRFKRLIFHLIQSTKATHSIDPSLPHRSLPSTAMGEPIQSRRRAGSSLLPLIHLGQRVDCDLTLPPGSRGVLPPPSPLRTVRASFPAYGSSPHTVDKAMKTGFSVSDGPFSDKRCLTSPSANVPHRVSPWSTSRKWASFRVGSLKRSNFFRLPYPPYYRATFAFSGLFYPLRHGPSLRLGYRLRGARGAYPVNQLRRGSLTTVTGVGGVCSPAGVGEHRRCQGKDNDPTRVTFWSRCISSFHLFYLTSLQSTLHYRMMVRL